MRRIIAVCATLSVWVAASTPAQSVQTADSLLDRGRLDRAESLYYAAVRVRPRDPVARWALGRFLAERGAQRVAVTLFEESLQFGGDPKMVSADLAPLYLALGDYHALATLPASPLTGGEKARAAWLETHPTRLIAPDSALTASFRTAGDDSSSIGHIPIRVNGRIVDALIDVASRGIILSDSVAGVSHVHMFVEKEAPRGRAAFAAAADSVGFGRLTITNAPLTVAPIKVPAIVGLDALARFAPTFDLGAGRITLRVSGTLEQLPANSTTLLTLVKPADWLVLQANGWVSMRDPEIARLLRGHRWTLDAKRGQIVLE
jgi:hypothetical protein